MERYSANHEIKALCKKKGVPLYAVARVLGKSDSTFSRMLRNEFDEAKKTEIIAIIDGLAR